MGEGYTFYDEREREREREREKERQRKRERESVCTHNSYCLCIGNSYTCITLVITLSTLSDFGLTVSIALLT